MILSKYPSAISVKMKIHRILALVIALVLCFALAGCIDSSEQKDGFTVVLQNSTEVGFTAWSDGTDGAKTVFVKTGEKLIIPKMVCDELDEGLTADYDYYFGGWYYKDKDGKERKLDLSTPFTLENLSVISYNLTVYVKVSSQWLGPR